MTTPTPEQQHIVERFTSGRQLAIEAGAGTGKTTTLVQCARAAPQRQGMYVAFNRAIVNESRTKLPISCEAATAHGLAMRAVGHAYRHRLDSPRMLSAKVARLLDLPTKLLIDVEAGKTKALAGGYLASLVMRGIRTFCATGDAVPRAEHLPFVHGIDRPGRTINNRMMRDEIAPALELAWSDLCNVDGRLRFEHDHYLKMWQLAEPTIAADYVLFDEAQDASPVMLAVMESQAKRGAQIVFVGDSCQPIGTMVELVVTEGAGGQAALTEQVPIERLLIGDRVVSYSIAQRHMRRRGSVVSGITERWFSGELVTVKAGPLASRYTPDHHCVVKVGAGLDGKHLVYVMRRGAMFRVGRAAAKYGQAFGPMLRAQAEGADALWILSAHDDAEHAGIAEATVAARFGLPMMLFRAASNRLMSQDGIDDFWFGMGDLTDRAAAALTAHGRDVAFPLWARGEDRLLIRRTRIMRACNVMDGMQMLDVDREWHPVSIGRERYDGPVVSMTVEGDHTYVGDGLVTHNCQQIYEWRGAVNALASVPADERAMLTQSWRFGDEIAEVANRVLAELESPLRLTGAPGRTSHVGAVADPDVVLCRSNSAAISTFLAFIKQGRRPHIVGGAVELIRFARAAIDLSEGRGTTHPELACFDSWREVQTYVAEDPSGDELELMVHLIDEYGPQIVLDALEGMPAEHAADVLVSTAHKAKGREWRQVRIASDFVHPSERGEGADGEWRLLYVSATRAMDRLDLRMCEPLVDVMGAGRQVFAW